jgi:hypothetical protein
MAVSLEYWTPKQIIKNATLQNCLGHEKKDPWKLQRPKSRQKSLMSTALNFLLVYGIAIVI